MKVFNLYLIAILLLFFSCKSSRNTVSPQEIEALHKLVNSQNFTIESNWAYPQVTNAMQQVFNSGILAPGNNASAISLIGNSNFLKISGDSITSYLPYFGERQMQVSYGGGDSAIQFNGLMENYAVVENKNKSYTISCRAKSNSESFDVMIRLFSNLKSEIFLNSSSRRSIQYMGEVEYIPEKK